MLIPKRLVGDNLEAAEEIACVLLKVDARGRVDDDAIFGRAGALFRVALIVPEARFLQHICQGHAHGRMVTANLFLMTSVLSDKGRTTP